MPVTAKEIRSWNPWHGCTRVSPGCLHCYVYRRDEAFGSPGASSLCRRTADFGLPVRRGRGGGYSLPSGSLVYTCFTSDFLLTDADVWRPECWRMIRERQDCDFVFFTKRIERLPECLPPDWGDGYENVRIGCTVENRDRADFRLPIFRSLPIKHRLIVAEPLLERLDLSPYLDGLIGEVSAGGESGDGARPCDYSWILDLRDQCVRAGVSFTFHQTGARFVKDGRTYMIRRGLQHGQAARAGLDFRAGDDEKEPSFVEKRPSF
jgi:protein gp37